MLCFFLLAFGVMTRLIVHEANFTPVIALVLFGGVYLERKYAVLLPILLMMVTDLILGLHSVILFTWGSLVLVSFMGLWLREHKTRLHVAGTAVSSAFVFYLVTNFGVWLSGYYPMTFQGLEKCYVMAIPFFRASLLSTIIYSVVLFGLYELVAFRARNTRFAHTVL